MRTLLKNKAKGKRQKATGVRSFAPAGARLAASPHRAFSLIEVLLAIFILGVGIISIAALFPAGIAQQRQSMDDIMGPTVANNALSILRSKIRPEDFGALDDFVPDVYDSALFNAGVRATIRGDWSWMRPGFMFGNNTATTGVNEDGAIDIFSGSAPFVGSVGGVTTASEFDGGLATSNPPLVGIPYNTRLYFDPATGIPRAPSFVFTRGERSYPMYHEIDDPALVQDLPRAQFVWDCMFRRFQGKILVAIFVYRVTVPGSVNALYSVAPNPVTPAEPPLPWRLNLMLAANSQWSADGPWKVYGLDGTFNTNDDNEALVRGTQGGTPFDPLNQPESWQDPRQWILDQNNNVHRVLGVSRLDDNPANPVLVELTRPISEVPEVPIMYFPVLPLPTPERVSDIWYIPLTDFVPGSNSVEPRYSLTPVYVTVKEL